MSNMAALPELPPQFKSVQHYLKTAVEHDKRDPVAAYYCRLYATQRAMEIDRKSPEGRTFIVKMMDHLENFKKDHPEEAIQNEVVGQAHMEHYALQIFLYADNEDRAGRFGKNVVKSFYTASMLMDVLSTFGELSEDLEKNKKYAKWKAAYIHKCLKDGITPQSGPLREEGEDDEGAAGGGSSSIGFEPHQPQPGPSHVNPNPYPNPYTQNNLQPSPGSGAHAPPTTPADPSAGSIPTATQAAPATRYTPPSTAGVNLDPKAYQDLMKNCRGAEKALQYEDVNTAVGQIGKGLNTLTNSKSTHLFAGGVQLQSGDYQHAMKYCKYAGSALQYQDSTTAIDYLTKALNLLTTGKE